MLFFVIPLVGAFIGWLFNSIVVYYTFNKVIPAKSKELGKQAGAFVSEKVLNMDKIASAITDPKRLAEVLPYIETQIDIFLQQKLKEKIPALAMFIGDKTIAMIKTSLMDEIESLLPGVLNKYLGGLGSQLNIEQMVADKLNNMPIANLAKEKLSKERNQFQLLGALGGLIIGLVSVLLTHMLG